MISISHIDHLCEGSAIKDNVFLKEEIQEWCTKNLKSSWKIRVGATSDSKETETKDTLFKLNIITISVHIDFENDTDAVHFKMRWF